MLSSSQTNINGLSSGITAKGVYPSTTPREYDAFIIF
jgi:hypothetical protein